MRTLVHDYSKTDILTRLVQLQSCKINAQKCYTVYKDYKSYTKIKLKKKRMAGSILIFRQQLVKSLTSLITGKREKSHIHPFHQTLIIYS